MARNFSPRIKRKKTISSPQQRIISQYFTPRSGISKEEVNFFVSPIANPSSRGQKTRRATGVDGPPDQITVTPAFGFTSAAKIYQQAGKWCSGAQNQQILFRQHNSGSSTCKSAVSESEHVSWKCSPLKNSSIEGQQTHIDTKTRVADLMASSTSSGSSTLTSDSSFSSSTQPQNVRHTRRSSSRAQNHLKGRPAKKQKGAPETITVDSGDEKCPSEDDCCVIVNVVGNRRARSDSEVVEITSCSQSSTESSSQSSQASKEESSSQSSCTSESDQKNTASFKKSSSSLNSARQTEKRASARSTFGLVGGDVSDSDDDDDLKCDSEFAQLPVEILENIFCQLPVIDLMLNCSLVCKKWYTIISRDSFIPWKKKYFLLKKKDNLAEDEMIKLLDDTGMLDIDLFPLHLARFMDNFKRKGHSWPSLLENLKTHCKFPLIETFLETLTDKSKMDPSPWSVVALLTLVCQTVREVQGIINCLTKSTSCLIHDILECFYCLASVFFYLDSQHRIGSGLHYRVFYTLYLYENAFEATCASIGSVFGQNSTGQQSMMRYRSATDKLQLTHEQVQIIKHDVKSGEIIKIVAFAGTGKTTTLVEYTKMRPMERFLNVAYNKSIQQHALKTFPSNVESRTIHSLAFRGVGFRYKHKLAFGLRISTIMNALPNECGYLHARRVEDTLKNFIASADTSVRPEHVPRANRAVVEGSLSEGSDIVQSIFGNHGADMKYLNSDKYIQKVVSHAELLWQRMRDQRDKDFPITHDGYLKIFQLNRPVLDGYDCLLVDEAQDCTPAASDILLRQSCAKILVGDPHQQIYSFRGARNALQEVASTHTFYLTQSFRFGPEIAYVASCVLDVLKGIRNKTLVGGSKRGSVMGERSGQLCIITRCNYTLFNEAVNVCCANNNTKVGFVGGLQGLALDRVLDIHKLFTAGTNQAYLGIKDPLIKKFRSFSELKKYAKVAPDPELLGKIKIVETHHVLLQHRIEKIKSKAVANLQQADTIFSTAHKAKGLEFDTVRVTDDFLPGSDIGMTMHEHGEDEKNLVYVAVSRAKKCLQLNSTILGILGSRKEHFVKAISPKEFTQPAICVSCKTPIDFSPRPHVLIQKEDITLGGNVKVAGGVLCASCALMKIPHVGCLAYVNVEDCKPSPR
ncbi:hypothetical protein ACROYT_G033506 [Oculina patagonica]